MRDRNSPEMLAFRAAAKACYLAGATYKELKELVATEDELTPLSERARYADDAAEDQ